MDAQSQPPLTPYRRFMRDCALRIARRVFSIGTMSCCALFPLFGQARSTSERIANELIARQSNEERAPMTPGKWSAEEGAELEGMRALWYNTAKGDYFRFVKKEIDEYVGTGESLDLQDLKLDSVSYGLLATETLRMYRVTLDARYYNAAAALRKHLQPLCNARSAGPGNAGGNEVCRSEPFLAEFASVFGESEDLARITEDFLRWDKDSGAPLPLQAGKASASAREVDRAWLAVALADSLDYYAEGDSSRATLIELMNRNAAKGAKYLGRRGGILNGASKEKQANEEQQQQSAAYLLIYAFLKGVRLGYLPASYFDRAMQSWQFAAERLHRRTGLDAIGT